MCGQLALTSISMLLVGRAAFAKMAPAFVISSKFTNSSYLRFPKITTQAVTLEAALLEVKQQIQKALRQYKNPPIPTKQDQIVVPTNSVLVLVKAS